MKPLKKLNESFNSGKRNNETTNINSTDTAPSSISTINNEQSIINGHCADIEQTAAHSNNAVVRHQQMVQNILLIWLDSNIDDNNADYRNAINQLRRAVNDIHTFTDCEECIEFIGDINGNKACMIISGSLGERIMPLVHTMSQVDSIFIFCDDKNYHEEWTKEWPKIKGVFTEISSIYEALKQAADESEQNAIPISFMATDADLSKKKLDQLDPMFMYSQILKEILLTIEFNEKHFQEYIDYCRTVFAENYGELQKVDKFQDEYATKTPIWWYAFDCFLYPMLNCVLRLMKMDVILKMGFFINDLHRDIQQLHSDQFNNNNSNESFTVYRGQGMSKTDFEQMRKTQGGLISFNNFLSTSKDRRVSFGFARRGIRNLDMVGILFVMTIDPTQSTIPFASIVDVGYYGDKEDEVLFSMHTVFRIGEIETIDDDERLFQANLTLTTDNDKDLRILTDRIREESDPDANGLYRLGLLLNRMGQFAKSQEVFEILLGQTTNETNIASIYYMLGWTKDNQGEYDEAIIFYEKALEMKRQSLPPNHSSLSGSYNNIGMVYEHMGDYPEALSYYEKALEIQQQSLPPDHFDLGASYNNIGGVYFRIGDYPTAIAYFEKTLEIKQKSLPPNHPSLGGSYNNISGVYFRMGDYSKALSHSEKALEIRQQSLPPNHPDLGDSYTSMGEIYRKMGNNPKALSFHEKALEIQKEILPPNHPSLGGLCYNIAGVYYSMDDYPKALSYSEKALEIRQQSLPLDHPDLGGSYMGISLVYYEMGDYSKALSSQEKALEIQQKSLPPNHPSLSDSYMGIGSMYYMMGDYSKALSSQEKALEIRQQSLPPNHPDLVDCYNNIGELYETMGNYSKAVLSYEHAVDIAQHSLPVNHPNLQMYLKKLEEIKKRV